MNLHELTTRNDIGRVLDAMALTRTGVEVGVAFGENAEVILQGSKLKTLLLVDPWRKVPGEDPIGYADAIKDWDGCMNYCRTKMLRFGQRAVTMQMTSVEAAALVADMSLDFCYIDANHMRPMVDADLHAWWPKVRIGGIFGGHDYHMVERYDYRCEVKAAVDEFFRESDYYIHVTQDQDPSWYVIK